MDTSSMWQGTSNGFAFRKTFLNLLYQFFGNYVSFFRYYANPLRVNQTTS